MSRKILRKVIILFILMVMSSNLLTSCSSSTTPYLNSKQHASTSDSMDKNENNGTKSEVTNADSSNSQNSNSENSNSDNKSIINNVKVKALYLTGWIVGNMNNVKHYIDLANSTEINSYVIDIKDDDGYVGYESDIQAVRDIGAWEEKYDVDKVIQAFHENNIYLIGRIVCFKDPILSSKRPDLAIKNSSGGLWRDNNGLPWLNPYNKDSWPYLIEIAKEGVAKGFDEIQFDYVRFANDGAKKAMNFGDTGDKKKYEAINEFLAYARKEMPNIVLSADVFGIICESPEDTEDIGQYLEYVGKDMDYISPMLYPSHYAVGQTVNGVTFVKPDLEPYGVVYNTLLKAKDRISKVDGYKAKVRPYLQDFTASWLGKGYYQTYSDEQVRQQIKAVTDAGYDEWILWDANNTYSESALLKEEK